MPIPFNTTRVIQRDATDPLDMTAAEIEERRQTDTLLDLFKRQI